jgi:5-methylcytosine-specific restriction endonuclease McrA
MTLVRVRRQDGSSYLAQVVENPRFDPRSESYHRRMDTAARYASSSPERKRWLRARRELLQAETHQRRVYKEYGKWNGKTYQYTNLDDSHIIEADQEVAAAEKELNAARAALLASRKAKKNPSYSHQRTIHSLTEARYHGRKEAFHLKMAMVEARKSEDPELIRMVEAAVRYGEDESAAIMDAIRRIEGKTGHYG